MYWLGGVLGRESVKKISGGRLETIRGKIAESGWVTVAIVRNLPVAPYTVVNLVAGVSRINFWRYLFGTMAGMAPGILAITVFSRSLVNLIKHPDPTSVGIFAAVVAAIVMAGLALRKLIRKKEEA